MVGDWVVVTFYRHGRHDVEMRVIGGFGRDKTRANTLCQLLERAYDYQDGPPPVVRVVREE